MLLLTGAAAVAPGEDVFLARSIEAYVAKRAQSVCQKIDSISIKKKAGSAENGVYRSEWDLTQRFRLDYTRPEEDPFLAGMVKCLAELKAGSSPEWVKWAGEEVSRYRKEVQVWMAYAQEFSESIVAVAKIDSAGYVDANTIKLQVAGVSEAVAAQSLLAGVPDRSAYEAIGYKYLADKRAGGAKPDKAAGQQSGQADIPATAAWPVPSALRSPATKASSGQSASPSQSKAPSQDGESSSNPEPAQSPSSSSSPSAPTQPASHSGGHSKPKEQTLLFLWAAGIMALLLVILIGSEVYKNNRR